jgi:hypothetical protein
VTHESRIEIVYASRTDALADLGLEEGKPEHAWRTSST